RGLAAAAQHLGDEGGAADVLALLDDAPPRGRPGILVIVAVVGPPLPEVGARVGRAAGFLRHALSVAGHQLEGHLDLGGDMAVTHKVLELVCEVAAPRLRTAN